MKRIKKIFNYYEDKLYQGMKKVALKKTQIYKWGCASGKNRIQSF